MKRKSILKIFTIIVIVTITVLCGNANLVFAEGEINNNIVEPQIKQLSSLRIDIGEIKALYTGKKIKKSVNIYDGSVKLVEGQDYTVSYKNNKKTGKATITINGKGLYHGTEKRNFYIVPKKAYIRDVIYSYDYKKATIEWDKDKQASGYTIYMATKKDGEYKKVKKIKKNSTTEYTVKNLKPKKMYYFKVCSYKKIDGKTYYSTKMSKAKTKSKKIAKISLVSYSSGSNRNHNLKLACKRINGTVLKPGEVFNWFKVVGPASASRGYRKATIFIGKYKRGQGYGGGVCQVSSTIYQAALETGCRILERHEHSQPVSYCKKGKDATVTYGVNNLRFKNTRKYSIKLVMYSDKGRTTCEVYRIN